MSDALSIFDLDLREVKVLQHFARPNNGVRHARTTLMKQRRTVSEETIEDRPMIASANFVEKSVTREIRNTKLIFDLEYEV